ncbi:MAG: hypothetical protein H6741_33895 [Alphaproteobacteria bacterium]|nr:hypothetical protein [Alphaproteobacteria bacterium]
MLLLALLGCGSPAPLDSVAPGPGCGFIADSAPPPGDEDALRALLALAQAQAWPELEGVEVSLETAPMSGDYFVASLDLSTLDDPPRERRYRVNFNVQVLEDPPSYAAVGAILAHELSHVHDYTGMEAEAMADFALWYAQADTAEYERATDLAAMERGCAQGLLEYRLWLYAHVDAETLEEKRRVYWTPEEIEAWMATNG